MEQQPLADRQRADSHFNEAENEIDSLAFDQSAQSLLTAAESFTRKIFHLPTLTRNTSVTARTTDKIEGAGVPFKPPPSHSLTHCFTKARCFLQQRNE